jgi:hypothetical protein
VATDLAKIVQALTAFHDFRSRALIVVGAGGGQLVEYTLSAARVVAVDRDRGALDRLRTKLANLGAQGSRFELIEADILSIEPRGDVLLFEFCLHEMADPAFAIAHARKLASEVIVVDHAPNSPWAFVAAEDQAVQRAWKVVEEQAPKRLVKVADAEQRFSSRASLRERMSAQAPTSLERVDSLKDDGEVVIAMPYWIALL